MGDVTLQFHAFIIGIEANVRQAAGSSFAEAFEVDGLVAARLTLAGRA